MGELKELFNQETLTDEQKSRVREIAAELGVDISYVDSGCSACKDRWRDAIVACYNAAVVKEKLSTDARYVLRSGVDVMFQGQRINALNMSDNFAEELIYAGFPPQLFARIDGQEATPELIRTTSVNAGRQREQAFRDSISQSVNDSAAAAKAEQQGVAEEPTTTTEDTTTTTTTTTTEETTTNETEDNGTDKASGDIGNVAGD